MDHTRKRVHSRYRVDLPARFREPGTFRWTEGSLINLSKGGVCLEVAPLPKGESRKLHEVGVSLEIEIPTVDREGKPQRRRMAAEVQWSKGRRYGLRFIQVKPPPAQKSKGNRPKPPKPL